MRASAWRGVARWALVGGLVGVVTTALPPAVWVLLFWSRVPSLRSVFDPVAIVLSAAPCAVLGAVLSVRQFSHWRAALLSGVYYGVLMLSLLAAVYCAMIRPSLRWSPDVYSLQCHKLWVWAVPGVPIFALIGATNGLVLSWLRTRWADAPEPDAQGARPGTGRSRVRYRL